MIKNLVQCVFKECGESFCVEISDSLWKRGDTFIFGCPKCGKSLAFDLKEAIDSSPPIVGPGTLTITIEEDDSSNAGGMVVRKANHKN